MSRVFVLRVQVGGKEIEEAAAEGHSPWFCYTGPVARALCKALEIEVGRVFVVGTLVVGFEEPIRGFQGELPTNVVLAAQRFEETLEMKPMEFEVVFRELEPSNRPIQPE